MTTLTWDELGERFFETGISKAVLYKADSFGVPWNGVTAVEENDSDTAEPVHFDGTKFNDIVTLGDYNAVLRAFTYPDEFLFYEGIIEDQTGFFAYNQPKSMFGLSYQTKIGSDIAANEAGYKIHMLWNLTALPAHRLYQTLALDTTPLEFEWTLSSVPEDIENFRPTSHAVIDSRKIDPELLKDIEGILYGDEDHEARLPPLKGFATFIRGWQRLIITDHGDGTWSAESPLPGQIVMLDDTTFQINDAPGSYLDADTYQIFSTEKNEDDIWLP